MPARSPIRHGELDGTDSGAARRDTRTERAVTVP
jgi:hypothetical protein